MARACERENLETLRKECDDALAGLTKEKDILKKLQKEEKEEPYGLNEESKRQLKAWKEGNKVRGGESKGGEEISRDGEKGCK